MKYLYKFWSVENQRGNGIPFMVDWRSELPDHNNREAIRGLQATKPDNRKRYEVFIYREYEDAYAMCGSAKIYNNKLVEFGFWELP